MRRKTMRRNRKKGLMIRNTKRNRSKRSKKIHVEVRWKGSRAFENEKTIMRTKAESRDWARP